MVYKDGWIPGNVGFIIMGQVCNIDRSSKVSDLIDGDLGQWKRDLIYFSFEQEEITQIVNIPLYLRGIEDKMIWHHEKNGDYFCSFNLSPMYAGRSS